MLFLNRSRLPRRWRCSWGIKRCVLVVAICTLLFASIFGSSSSCDFPAIYNFGDSNSDTGAASAAFTRLNPPNGRTYFGKPSGRYCDGRLMIDFIAEKLGLPFLSPYLDSIESNFRHGANFAASGSTAQPAEGKILGAGFSPLSLNIQLSQFQQLKARTNEIYNNKDKDSSIKSRLPRPDDFSKALYTLDSGQNDLHFALTTMSEKQARASIPDIVDQYASAIETLYKGGARMFWIHNTGPIGCLPIFVVQSPPKPGEGDEIGCIKSHNEVAEEFNKQLQDKVVKLRSQLDGALLILVDIYTAKYSLISKANKNGFIGPFNYCCGRLGEPEVDCWSTNVINGTDVYPGSCAKPWKYISWDSVHYTEAANSWVAERIIDGSLSDPSVPINKACQSPKR